MKQRMGRQPLCQSEVRKADKRIKHGRDGTWWGRWGGTGSFSSVFASRCGPMARSQLSHLPDTFVSRTPRQLVLFSVPRVSRVCLPLGILGWHPFLNSSGYGPLQYQGLSLLWTSTSLNSWQAFPLYRLQTLSGSGIQLVFPRKQIFLLSYIAHLSQIIDFGWCTLHFALVLAFGRFSVIPYRFFRAEASLTSQVHRGLGCFVATNQASDSFSPA